MGTDPSLLPEPWEEFRPLYTEIDKRGATKVELTRSWVVALHNLIEPAVAAFGFAWIGLGKLSVSEGTATITTKVGSAIAISLGFLLWSAANFSAADAPWNVLVAPYLRSRRQIHALYGSHSNLLIRLALGCVGISTGCFLGLLVYTHPLLLATAAILVGLFGVFFSRVQIASLIFLVPGISLIWAVRRLGLPPATHWMRSLCAFSSEPVTRTLVLHHISDLHLLDANQCMSAEGEAIQPKAVLESVKQSIARLPDRPRLIVITGDITDTASASGWKDCFDWMARMRSDLRDVEFAFIPGNHDINIVTSGELRLTSSTIRNYLKWIRYLPLESEERRLQDINLLRCLLAMGRHFGDKAQCITSNQQSVGLNSLIVAHAQSIHRFVRTPFTLRTETYDPDHPDAKRDEFGSVPPELLDIGVWSPEYRDVTDVGIRELLGLPRMLWKQAWPMIVRSFKLECNLILLNSTRLSWSITDNAFGEVGSEQLDRVLELHRTAANPGWPNIVLLHHSIPPPPDRLGRTSSPFLCLEDAALVVERLAHLHPVYLSGHTHCQATVGRWLAASSLGYAEEPSMSVSVHELRIDRSGEPVAIQTTTILPERLASQSPRG